MKVVVRGTLAALLCGGAAVAGAQGTTGTAAGAAAPACDVGGGSGSSAKAVLFLQRAAQEMQGKKDPTKDLKTAIADLTAPAGKGDDSVSRAYYLGQAYVLLLQQPGVQPTGVRSSYGIASNPTGTVDLFAAADSAFTLVESTHPACARELAGWRQQKPWLDALNGSIAALNAQHYDTAETLARRALTIDRRAPYAYSVLAAIANERKDYAGAAALLQKAITAAGSDTLYRDAKLNATYDLASNLSLEAQGTTGPNRRAIAEQAAQAWERYIAAGTQDAQLAHAIATAGTVLQGVSDTAGLRAIYAPVLANPSRYGEQALLNAGVIATRAGHAADAATLFAAVLQQNPNERDALKNLAASYVGLQQPAKIPPLVSRLVSLDPNNSDNWLLYAYAYSGLLKETHDRALTRAYTDSLVKYNAKAKSLTPLLTVTEFTFGQSDSTVTLAGTVQNHAKTAHSTSVQVEFLDRSGAVVGRGSANVGPIPPGGSAPFTVSAKAPTAVAYRYLPLS